METSETTGGVSDNKMNDPHSAASAVTAALTPTTTTANQLLSNPTSQEQLPTEDAASVSANKSTQNFSKQFELLEKGPNQTLRYRDRVTTRGKSNHSLLFACLLGTQTLVSKSDRT